MAPSCWVCEKLVPARTGVRWGELGRGGGAQPEAHGAGDFWGQPRGAGSSILSAERPVWAWDIFGGRVTQMCLVSFSSIWRWRITGKIRVILGLVF